MYACLRALVNCVAFYAITYLVKKRWLWVEVFEVVSFCDDLMFSWAMRTFLFLSRGSLFHILYPRISLMLMATWFRQQTSTNIVVWQEGFGFPWQWASGIRVSFQNTSWNVHILLHRSFCKIAHGIGFFPFFRSQQHFFSWKMSIVRIKDVYSEDFAIVLFGLFTLFCETYHTSC